MTPEEQIIELKTALLCIHSQVVRFTVALDRLADTIRTDAAPVAATATTTAGHTTHAENTNNFQQNVLIYAQRRAARRTLTAAVHAGALIPRDALGFVVEQPESSDENIDILHLRPLSPVDYSDDSESETPVQDTGLQPGAQTSATMTAAAVPSETTRPILRNPNNPISARAARRNRRQFHISVTHRTAIEQAQLWIVGYRARSAQRSSYYTGNANRPGPDCSSTGNPTTSATWDRHDSTDTTGDPRRPNHEPELGGEFRANGKDS
eukprot:scaffold114199_cov42-Attheya_sp.AAC.1